MFFQYLCITRLNTNKMKSGVSCMIECVLLTVGALFSVFIVIFSIVQGKKGLILYSFIAYHSMIFIIATAELLHDINMLRWHDVLYRAYRQLPACFGGVTILIFALAYTNNKMIFKKKNLFLLLFMPFVFYLITITNDYHQIIPNNHRESSIVYAFIYMFSGVYFLIGTILLIRYCVKNLSSSRKQSILMTIVAAIVLTLYGCFSLLNYFIISTYGSVIKIMTFLIVISASVLFSILAFKYRFLNTYEALGKIVNSIREPVFFADIFNKIIYKNSAYNELLENICRLGNHKNINSFIDGLVSVMEDVEENWNVVKALKDGTYDFSSELAITLGREITFTVKIQTVSIGRELLGRVVYLSDVTEYKLLLNELNMRNTEIVAANEEIAAMNEDLTETNKKISAINEELLHANDKLKKHAETVEELTIEKERNRFARDTHDSIGHALSMLITLLEVCNITYENNSVETKNKLNEALKFARDGMKEIRRSISGLAIKTKEEQGLKDAINELASNFSISGINVDFLLEGDETVISLKCYDAIYRICQESLTNSLKHGKAKNVTLIIRFENTSVKIYIFDDGIGCKTIKKGFGLTGMESRVKELNGSVEFGSDGEKGFNIFVDIPLGG